MSARRFADDQNQPQGQGQRVSIAWPSAGGRPRLWWGCPLPTATAWEDGRPSAVTEPADGWWTQERCGDLLVWLEIIKPTLLDLLERPDRAAERRADREWIAMRRKQGRPARSLSDALRRRPRADPAWIEAMRAAAARVGGQLRDLVAEQSPAQRWTAPQIIDAIARSPSVLARLWEAGWIERPDAIVPSGAAVAFASRGRPATYENAPSKREDLFQ
jgi:hypothetical protein